MQPSLFQRSTPALALGAAVLAGLSAGLGEARLLGIALVVAVICVVASKLGVEIIAGVLVVACLDGIPGINLQSFNAHGSFQYTDIPILALLTSAVWRWWRDPTGRSGSRYLVPLLVWSAMMIAFWIVGLWGGVAFGAPIHRAALFAREYLYWAVLLPLAPFLFADYAGIRRFCVTIALLTSIFCLLLIFAALGLIPSSLVNANYTLSANGITRIYTYMGDTNLIDAVFCGAVAFLLLRTGRSVRWALVVAAICGVAIVVLLTRALWAGVGVGLILSGALWSVRGGLAGRPRRRLAGAGGGLVAAILVVLLFAPSSLSANSSNPVVSRVANGLTEYQATSGSLAVRSDVASIIKAHLKDHWVLGLGFRDPQSYYVLGLPEGDIQDSDVSLLNSVSTMGIVGTVVLFLPVLAVLLTLIRRSGSSRETAVIYLGGTIWIVSGLVSAYTLGFVESAYGICTVAVVLGAIIRALELDSSSGGAVPGSRLEARATPVGA